MAANKAELSKLDRIVATGLAAVFMTAGVTGVAAGGATHQWAVAIVGLASIWWSTVWMRVAYKGRRLESRELLWPFRRT